jgi:glycerol-3-phosphate dehydrogenase
MLTRGEAFGVAGGEVYDAVIIGGGVSGAAVFRELATRGYRVLLVEQNDFASGTSQASGMLVWGGLLYLKNLELRTVHKLSAARDGMLSREPEQVERLRFRYMPLKSGGRSRLLVKAALHAYWHLGGRRRERPFSETSFPCAELLNPERFAKSLVYEEAGLTSSDSRFTLGRLLGRANADQLPLNYCALEGAHWNRASADWSLDLTDRIGGGHVRARARTLINAGGIWADRINEFCGIESGWRHVFSKGVYLAFRRPELLDEALVFEMGQNGDSQTFTPWGPVALWGPTETAITRIEDGFAPSVEDVRFLLDQANRNLREQRGPEDIVSMRCGVRPLAVRRGYSAERYPLELSRRHVVERDRERAALTLYGGKITSSATMATEVARALEDYVIPRRPRGVRGKTASRAPLTESFPGLDRPLPDPRWCVEHEGCATLEDYLRRRTNLAQWLPRHGLGAADEHVERITGIARAIHGEHAENGASAETAVAKLRRRADRERELLGAV